MADETRTPDSTELAIDRTWLAHERTLMAWVRTAVSMITFAFTIYKFFQFEQGKGVPVTRGLITPRDFALMLVGLGLISLLLATIGHWRNIRILQAHLHRVSMAFIVAILVSLFGILVFVTAILRD